MEKIPKPLFVVSLTSGSVALETRTGAPQLFWVFGERDELRFLRPLTLDSVVSPCDGASERWACAMRARVVPLRWLTAAFIKNRTRTCSHHDALNTQAPVTPARLAPGTTGRLCAQFPDCSAQGSARSFPFACPNGSH